jgi:hypothetical protein
MPNNDNGLQELMAEMAAQQAAGRVVEGRGSVTDALLAVRKALDVMGSPTSMQDTLSRAAMQKILGQPILVLDGVPSEENWEAHLFETVGMAWLAWANGSDPTRTYRESQRITERLPEGSPEGAVHVMTLRLWFDAVKKLAEGDRTTSKLLWDRAIEVGSSSGTESHSTILWAYIATFFPLQNHERVTSVG